MKIKVFSLFVKVRLNMKCVHMMPQQTVLYLRYLEQPGKARKNTQLFLLCIKSNGLLLSQPELSLCHIKTKVHPLKNVKNGGKSSTVFSFSRESPSLDSPGPQSFEPASCMPGVMLWCRLGKGHCVFFNGRAGKGMCIRNLENLLSGICRGRYTGRIQLSPF